MSDPAHDRYATLTQVQKWAPYNPEDWEDDDVYDAIESASRDIIITTNHKWVITDPAYDDIEIICCYLTGALMRTTKGDVEKAKWYQELAMGKLRRLVSAGGGPDSTDSDIKDAITVSSQPRGYYLATTLDPSQTTVKPYKSRY